MSRRRELQPPLVGQLSSSPTTGRSDRRTSTSRRSPRRSNADPAERRRLSRDLSSRATRRSALGATDNYYTFASDYGDVTTYWHGVDVSDQRSTAKRRSRSGRHERGPRRAGLLCRWHDKLPELLRGSGCLDINPRQPAGRRVCGDRAVADWGLRGLVSFTIPKVGRAGEQLVPVDAQTSSRRPSTPSWRPTARRASANYNVTSADPSAVDARPAAARPVWRSKRSILTLPGDVYPDRISALDLRLAKILRFVTHPNQRRDRFL